ncbi:MAG: nitroreductase family protein [Pseudomonadota bacterium]
MEFSELEHLIKSRRSIRRWQDNKPVSEDILLKAVELATWAPSGGNQQNWHFYIITNKKIIGSIADAVQASISVMASWPEAATFGDTFRNYLQLSDFFRSAPAAIVIAASSYQSVVDQLLELREKVDPKAKEMMKWRNIADSKIQSTSAAVTLLLLILHQMGLGATWMTGPIQSAGEIKKILDVKPELDIVTFIPVGYPAEEPKSASRKPINEVTYIMK